MKRCPTCGRPHDKREPMTAMQSQVLTFIKSYKRDHRGLTPTFREIGLELGVSGPTVHGHIGKLEAKGWISRPRKHSRQGIRVIV